MDFISKAATALKGFESDPASEITSGELAASIDALSRIPLIGPDFANIVRPAIGQSAVQSLLGPIRTWMHRALESIQDEKKFRRVLLRLLQAGLPLYAQLRHGPIEYGKDLATLVEHNGTAILRLYQVKCGEIDKKKWRESEDELKEMFLVPLESFQLPVVPARVEYLLITNGHANPYVEPVMQAWFREQHEQGHRDVQFMHLDSLVDWITKSKLTSELKIALAEQEIAEKQS